VVVVKWKLQKRICSKSWEELSDEVVDWNKAGETVKRITDKIRGKPSGGLKCLKEIWWLNDDVKKGNAIHTKQENKKQRHLNRENGRLMPRLHLTVLTTRKET